MCGMIETDSENHQRSNWVLTKKMKSANFTIKILSKVLRGCAGISFYYPVPLRQPQRLRQTDDPAKQRHS